VVVTKIKFINKLKVKIYKHILVFNFVLFLARLPTRVNIITLGRPRWLSLILSVDLKDGCVIKTHKP